MQTMLVHLRVGWCLPLTARRFN